MNINKAQRELFNAMLAGRNLRRFELGENRVFITPDGYHGFVLSYSQIQINLDKIETMKAFPFQSIITEENLCKLSKEILLDERRGRKRYLRKLKNEKFIAYFDDKYMQCFQNPKFYSTSPTSTIVVTEDISATRKNEMVGVIIPVRIVEEDFFE